MSRKIVLVTGASRGIGRAIAERFAKDGHFVIGTATSEKGAAAISEYLSESGGIGRVLNVCSDEDIDTLFDEIDSVYGSVNVLINNAGITKDGLLMRMKQDDWADVIDTNLTSIYRTSRRAVKGMMKARFGRIINITSVVGQMGNAGQTNYAASKAGVEGFTKSLAREIGSRGVTVNCVAPGFVETDMTEELDERMAQPHEIAAAVAFLASDDASYITGASLAINGGMYM